IRSSVGRLVPIRSVFAVVGTFDTMSKVPVSSAFRALSHPGQSPDRKLRALAVTAATRSPALPDVPTLDELGIKNQEAETMQGVLLPAGTPKSIVDLLQTEIARIIHLPDVKDKLLAIGLEPDGMSSAAFAAYIKADVAKWKKVIADAKIPQIGG